MIQSQPRKNRKGGGVLVIYNKFLDVKRNAVSTFRSFEYLDLTIHTLKSVIRLVTVYRPPSSERNKCTPDDFFSDFSTLLETLTLSAGHLIILGDFNFHIDVPQNSHGSRFLELLQCANLCHHVHEATHRSGHILDNVITRTADDIITHLDLHHDAPSDHSAIAFLVSIPKPKIETKIITKRNIRHIDRHQFNKDVCERLVAGQSKDTDNLASEYSNALSDIFDKHAPPITKAVRIRDQAKWYTDQIRRKRSEKRRWERIWKKSRLTVHKLIFKNHCQAYYKLIKA